MTRFLIALVALSVAGVSDGLAASMSQLQGAWAMDGTDCAQIFEKEGEHSRFRDRTASTSAGIIVSGNKVIGSQMSCTAEKFNAGTDHFSAYLDCADSIMFSTISVSFRIVDQDHFDRFDPLFPESSIRYHRCGP